jgi:hypothetical protein
MSQRQCGIDRQDWGNELEDGYYEQTHRNAVLSNTSHDSRDMNRLPDSVQFAKTKAKLRRTDGKGFLSWNRHRSSEDQNGAALSFEGSVS